MNEYELIKGKQRKNVFNEIQSKKTLLTIKLHGSNFEQLTVITDIKTFNSIPYFIVDLSHDFKKAISNSKNLKIGFNFICPDKIEHNFDIIDFMAVDDEIWLKFPEFIERLQRRKTFRIAAPYSSQIICEINSISYKFHLIDISQGGVLGIPAGLNLSKKASILKIGETIDDAVLLLTDEEGSHQLNVRELTIKWVAKEKKGQFFRYGMEFTKIKKKEDKLLTKIIYNFQRLFLQRR